jgi:hypothetical protein
MNLNKHYKISEFLKEEFDKLKAGENDKKIKSNFYKQQKHRGKMAKLLLKVEEILLKVDSVNKETVEKLRGLQDEIKKYLT